jgi:hypothetical protein
LRLHSKDTFAPEKFLDKLCGDLPETEVVAVIKKPAGENAGNVVTVATRAELFKLLMAQAGGMLLVLSVVVVVAV